MCWEYIRINSSFHQPGWKCARDARGRNGISRNRAQLRYNAPFLARFRAWCEYAILRNLAVYRAMPTNTSGLSCIPLASLRETNRGTSVYALGHDVGLRSAGKLRFLSNGPYSRHEVTTDILAVIFARISVIRARNGVNRARKRGPITRNTVEIPRVLARSRAHFHAGRHTSANIPMLST